VEVIKRTAVRGQRTVLALCLAAIVSAQNWPSFRGERALGVVSGVKLPSSWDLKSGTNVAWNVAVPGLAHSSPVVWGDRIFLTTAISADPNSVLQFPLDGKLLWKQDVGTLDQGAFDLPEYKWGYASSPIIYKNLVIVQCDQQKGSFLAAYDADTGKQVWRADR